MKFFINILLPLFLWITVVAYSLFWNTNTLIENNEQNIKNIGRSFFKEIQTTRLWNAKHGGVYVVVTDKTQPNPYLDVPNRDITTPSGIKLTKVNPAFMTREIAEIAKKESNVQYHITSLKPIRPANKADTWETKALQSFENGKIEIMELITSSNVYRFMAPLPVKKACLKCHAKQGYKEGDIRGGISVTIPSGSYIKSVEVSKNMLKITHFIALFVGIIVFFVFKNYRDKQIKLINNKNKDLELAKTAAEIANKAKSMFLSNMSHELRTPLNAILGFTQLLFRDKNLSAKQQEDIAIIRRSGEHLLNLINDVLDMSKIEAERLTLNKESFNLHQLINDVDDMCRIKAEEKNLQLLFDLSPEVPKYILTDQLRLRQVLLNLINNALKFTSEGRISVRCGIINNSENSLNNKVDIRFEIEDSGTGISKEELEVLFDAFIQTTSGKNSKEGTGLGLTISRKFIQLMGGEINVTSEKGKGSIFKFNIIAFISDESKITKDISLSSKIIALEPSQKRFKILIVDDRKTNRKLLIRLLAPLGFELKEAQNGKEAVDIFKEWEPNLIWLDMRMPVMDGYEAAKIIKSSLKGQSTAVIALTASTLEEERAMVLSAGCDDFLRKPFKENEIFNAMEKHIGVKYIYECNDNKLKLETVNTKSNVTLKAIKTLTAELRNELKQAVIRANTDATNDALNKIKKLNPELAFGLKEMIKDFEYEKILNLIKDFESDLKNNI